MDDEMTEFGITVRMLWAEDEKWVQLTVCRHYREGNYEAQDIVFTPGDVDPGESLRDLARNTITMIAEHL